MSDEALRRWAAAEDCKDRVLRFMALFDARDYVAMEACVTDDLEWQRPDRTIRGVAELREVLAATARDILVRHVITNLQVRFEGEERVVVESYYTVYRDVGGVAPAALTGPASMGRYRDELHRRDGAWKLARKQTMVDFRAR